MTANANVDEGVSLLAMVEAGRDRKRLDELGIARVIADLAEVLDDAHGTIVPSNVLISRAGKVSLDAKRTPEDDKLAYTAPERLRGEPGDARSDVFSLGVVMWEALAHARLFEGFTEAETKKAVLDDTIEPPSSRNANIPSVIDVIVMRALSRDTKARYATPKAMAVEIESMLRDADYGLANDAIAKVAKGLPKEMFRKPATIPPPVAAKPKFIAKESTGTMLGFPQPKPPSSTGIPVVDDDGRATAPGVGIPAISPADMDALSADTKPSRVGLDSVPVVAKPVEAKPVEAKPVEAKPIEAKPVEASKPSSIMKGSATVMGVPKLDDSMAPSPKFVSSRGMDTMMGVPRLADMVADTPIQPAIDGPAVVSLGKPETPSGPIAINKAESQPIELANKKSKAKADALELPAGAPLVPNPPKLPSGPNLVPKHIAAAETQATPQVEAKPANTRARAASVTDFDDDEPSPIASVPARDADADDRDMLAGWGQTGASAALDDDDVGVPPASKRPLIIAIAGAAVVLGIVVIIAMASGGSKDSDDHAAAPKPPTVAMVQDPGSAVTPPPTIGSAGSDGSGAVSNGSAGSVGSATTAGSDQGSAIAGSDSGSGSAVTASSDVGSGSATTASVEPAKTEPEPAKVEPKIEPKVTKTEPKKTEPKKTEPTKIAKADKPDKAEPSHTTRPRPKADAPIDPYPDSKPDAETSYRNGVQAFARGDSQAALISLRTAQESNPRYAPTYRGLGLVYEKMGDRAQAARNYRKYLKMAPSAGDAEQIRARLERLGS